MPELPRAGQNAATIDPDREIECVTVFKRDNFGRDFRGAGECMRTVRLPACESGRKMRLSVRPAVFLLLVSAVIYGCGGGDYTSISQLGTHGLYNDVWSTDIVGQDAGAVFVMLYGSHFGEWDATDDGSVHRAISYAIGVRGYTGRSPEGQRQGFREPPPGTRRLAGDLVQ